MSAPVPNRDSDVAPAPQIDSGCSIHFNPAEQANAAPLSGPHHCIGTGHNIVNTFFRYLQIKCASHGGTLTDSDLAELQIEFVDDFHFMFDQFENVHSRCMYA